MGTIAEKGAYTIGTKSLLKQKINNLGGSITDETTFREYANQLQSVYENAPKTSYQTGTEITLSPTLKGKLDFEDEKVGYGDTYQEGTPTPDSPQNIKSVTGEQEVVMCGKNVFNKSMSYTTSSGNTITTSELPTGIRVTQSTNTYNYSFCIFAIKNLTDYEGKTVRAKANFTKSGDNRPNLAIGLCDVNGQNRQQLANTLTSGAEISFIVPETTKYLALWLYSTNNSSGEVGDYADYTDIIITIDNADMTYMPYVTPQTLPLNLGNIELNKIGDYQDYIYKNDGKWYKKEYIGKITLNGNQTVGSTTYSDLFLISVNNLGGISYIEGGFSNNFAFINDDTIIANTQAESNMSNNQMAFRMGTTKDRLYIKTDIVSSESALKQWFTTHNTSIYYVKANANDIEITDTTLINQLEAIYNAKSYNGTTNITSSGSLPMIIKARALKGA